MPQVIRPAQIYANPIKNRFDVIVKLILYFFNSPFLFHLLLRFCSLRFHTLMYLWKHSDVREVCLLLCPTSIKPIQERLLAYRRECNRSGVLVCPSSLFGAYNGNCTRTISRTPSKRINVPKQVFQLAPSPNAAVSQKVDNCQPAFIVEVIAKALHIVFSNPCYFTFPIVLLRGRFQSVEGICSNPAQVNRSAKKRSRRCKGTVCTITAFITVSKVHSIVIRHLPRKVFKERSAISIIQERFKPCMVV